MKKFTKLIAMLLAIVMLIGVIPMGFAADGDAAQKAPAASTNGDLPFVDVPKEAWFYNAVRAVYKLGYFNGTSETTFSPNAPMTRAMLVTVLYRVFNKSYVNAPNVNYPGIEPSRSNYFSDVPQNAWYAKAVNWAASFNIVNGVGNGKFDPDGTITREQVGTIIYRFLKYVYGWKECPVEIDPKVDLRHIQDADKISDWALEGVTFCVKESIIFGTANNNKLYLNPQGNASRAELSAIVHRLVRVTGVES